MEDFSFTKKIFKGNIVHTPTMDGFKIIEHGYIIVEDGKVESIEKELPLKYKDYPIRNFSSKLIIPGFVDLHLHSVQYPNRGLCLDLPLMDWLLKCAFPSESKFRNIEYAKKVYSNFIKELWKAGTTRSVIYDSVFCKSAELLVDMLINSGMSAYVGKANMDINAPDYLLENTNQSLIDTERFIINTQGRSKKVKPAIYPRFIPSSSPKLLQGLGELASKYKVPVISHLSESIHELNIVKKMYPDFENYADIYNYYGLLGQTPTIMAHAVYSNEEERKLLKKNNVWVAHSPISNFNLGSGLMPTRLFINEGLKVGLGSDIGAGAEMGISESIRMAIATSKMVWLMSGEKLQPLRTHEAFYLGTKGGGSFFGKVGSFEPGYEFDALIIDDTPLLDMEYTVEERIQRFIYIGSSDMIISRYVNGENIPEPFFT